MSASDPIASRHEGPSNSADSGPYASARRDLVRPVVGLTSYLQKASSGVWDVEASFLPAIYIDGVTRAGGIATLLPPQPVDDTIA